MPPKRKGFHRHHIIPKHAGGTDDDSNIVYLTPEEHAKEHLRLYEEHGRYEDAQAYNSLRKHWLGSRKVDGYKQSPEHIAKRVSRIDYKAISEKTKGRPGHTAGMKFGRYSEDRIKKIAESNRGQTRSLETRKKISEATRKTNETLIRYTFMCIGCRKPVSPNRIFRHSKCTR